MPSLKDKRLRQKEWLDAYLEFGTQSQACLKTGVDKRTITKWRLEAKFKRAMDEVKNAIADGLESEAIRRAKDGSDNLLIFLLKGHKPEKFRERYESKSTHEAGDSLSALLATLPSTLGPPGKRDEKDDD